MSVSGLFSFSYEDYIYIYCFHCLKGIDAWPDQNSQKLFFWSDIIL